MSRRPSYKNLQRAIARDDKHGIEARWIYGRTLITDPRKMAPSGKSLRHGAIEALVADAKAVGSLLSRREIQYRIQCARTYPTITEMRTAACAFEDWTAFRESGFPAVDEDAAPSPDRVLDDLEERDRQEFEQLGMFPDLVNGIPVESATLRHLEAYAAQMRQLTANYHRTDEKRAAHLRELRAAVGDDLDVTYADAVAALTAART